MLESRATVIGDVPWSWLQHGAVKSSDSFLHELEFDPLSLSVEVVGFGREFNNEIEVFVANLCDVASEIWPVSQIQICKSMSGYWQIEMRDADSEQAFTYFISCANPSFFLSANISSSKKEFSDVVKFFESLKIYDLSSTIQDSKELKSNPRSGPIEFELLLNSMGFHDVNKC